MGLARRMLHDAAMRSILPALVTAALATGCYATTSGSVGYGVTATTVAPDLVYVSPGVQVIADYDEPVFYSDGFYWRETGGTWYRSSYHTGGWVYAQPPRAVFSIESRHSYRRYRPAGYVRRNHDSRPVYRDNRRDSRPVYRDNRRDSRPVYRDNRRDSRPAPVIHRDNRNDRRDRRDDKRDDRRDRRR